MGVDLRLLPLISPNFWASHDMLGLERRRELWTAIEELPQFDIPEALYCFCARAANGEAFYGMEEESPYGNRLKYTTVGDLLTLAGHPAVIDNWKNRAVWLYLSQMPPEWQVVLYWH